MNQVQKIPSPCLSCTRVKNPHACENKYCRVWREWFVQRWELIRSYPRTQMDRAVLKPVGVNVGGTVYAPPHQVKDYVNSDPCKTCLCPKELCTEPCKVRRAWEQSRKETFV